MLTGNAMSSEWMRVEAYRFFEHSMLNSARMSQIAKLRKMLLRELPTEYSTSLGYPTKAKYRGSKMLLEPSDWSFPATYLLDNANKEGFIKMSGVFICQSSPIAYDPRLPDCKTC